LNDNRNPLPEELKLLTNAPQEAHQSSLLDTPIEENSHEEPKTEEEEEEKDKSNDLALAIPTPFVTYNIQPGDTLIGISLKFAVPIEVLKKHNYLPHGYNVYHLKAMQIPTWGKDVPIPATKPMTRPEQLKEFKRKAGQDCTLEEAKFYMENSNYDEAVALKEFKEDREWSTDSTTDFHPSVRTETIPNKNKVVKESKFKK